MNQQSMQNPRQARQHTIVRDGEYLTTYRMIALHGYETMKSQKSYIYQSTLQNFNFGFIAQKLEANVVDYR